MIALRLDGGSSTYIDVDWGVPCNEVGLQVHFSSFLGISPSPYIQGSQLIIKSDKYLIVVFAVCSIAIIIPSIYCLWYHFFRSSRMFNICLLIYLQWYLIPIQMFMFNGTCIFTFICCKCTHVTYFNFQLHFSYYVIYQE